MKKQFSYAAIKSIYNWKKTTGILIDSNLTLSITNFLRRRRQHGACIIAEKLWDTYIFSCFSICSILSGFSYFSLEENRSSCQCVFLSVCFLARILLVSCYVKWFGYVKGLF